MEICSIRIDFDKDILEVNGKKVEKPVTVALPEPDGWPIQKMFNPEVKPYEEYGRINIEVSISPTFDLYISLACIFLC